MICKRFVFSRSAIISAGMGYESGTEWMAKTMIQFNVHPAVSESIECLKYYSLANDRLWWLLVTRSKSLKLSKINVLFDRVFSWIPSLQSSLPYLLLQRARMLVLPDLKVWPSAFSCLGFPIFYSLDQHRNYSSCCMDFCTECSVDFALNHNDPAIKVIKLISHFWIVLE